MEESEWETYNAGAGATLPASAASTRAIWFVAREIRLRGDGRCMGDDGRGKEGDYGGELHFDGEYLLC